MTYARIEKKQKIPEFPGVTIKSTSGPVLPLASVTFIPLFIRSFSSSLLRISVDLSALNLCMDGTDDPEAAPL